MKVHEDSTRDAIAEQLAVLWSRMEIDAAFEPDSDDVLVMQSLEAVGLKSAIEAEFDVEIELGLLFSNCTINSLANAVIDGKALESSSRGVVDHFRPRPEQRFEPFPLTDVQQAYWLGSQAFELGGRSTHVYLEAEVRGFDLGEIESAFNALIARHDMLRAVVLPDGRQQVLRSVPEYRIRGIDLTASRASTRKQVLEQTRDELGHQAFDSQTWPLYEVRAHVLPESRVRLCLSIDMLFADAGTLQILAADWARLLTGFEAEPEAAEPVVTFRDYVVAVEDFKQTSQYADARDYWTQRAPELAAAPTLPVVTGSGTGDSPEFTRRTATLDAICWQRIKERAAELGATPAMLLCAAYALVVRKWSTSGAFTLNLTFADRPQWDRELAKLAGDFSSTILLECDLREHSNLSAATRSLQAQFREDLQHRCFSGVQVQREIAKLRGPEQAMMPVVFTALLSEGGLGELASMVSLDYGISQTPQVYLDNQVSVRDGELIITWDAIDGLFPAGVLDDMFTAYSDLLHDISVAPTGALDLVVNVPESQLAVRPAAVEPTAASTLELIHDRFDRAARAQPNSVAVVTSCKTLSYGELDGFASGIAAELGEIGIGRGDLVAVIMRKGWEQVAGVLGVNRAGAAYLPIDADLPSGRIARLIEVSGVRAALVQPGVEPPEGVNGIVVDDALLERAPDFAGASRALPDDLAYVIFTSGSTGNPKGVMISHAAVVNTLHDISRRLVLTAEDRVLCLSSLSFDLSVFDIFGVLGCGGTVVLPDTDKTHDPAHWLTLVNEHRVTVWNTVPALLELLVEHAEQASVSITDVRAVLLSGDWIPLTLPDRVRAVVAGIPLLFALGGATEASIWSIGHLIGDVDPRWRSIPYGRQLDNQTVEVLSENLRQTPDHVVGEIHIGGIGVATGYLGDPVRTAERFIVSGGRSLYKTGDLGRYLPDGSIEILGRNDFQVKVGGYRIELGEIEYVLAQHGAARSVVVAAKDTAGGSRRLVAYVVTDGGRGLDESDLRAFCADRLPAYMIPAAFVTMSALPLSSNGKIDRSALPEPHFEATAYEQPEGPLEQMLAQAWKSVLSVERVGRHDEFLSSGGDSLLAIRIISRVSEAGYALTVREFFENPTIAGQARVVRVRAVDTLAEGDRPGPVGLSASQEWFFDQRFADGDHWNGMWPLFELNEALDVEVLGEALRHVVNHHGALRVRYEHADGIGTAAIPQDPADGMATLTVVDLSAAGHDYDAELGRYVASQHGSLNLSTGPSVRVTYFTGCDERRPRLLISAHWLVMDYYSSRVFFEDLTNVYAQLVVGQPVILPPHNASLAESTAQLRTYANSAAARGELAHWTRSANAEIASVPVDFDLGPNVQGSADRHIVSFTGAVAEAIMAMLSRQGDLELRDVLVAALARVVADWSGSREVMLELEGHGRNEVFGDLDVIRTIGRFSTLSPALIQVTDAADAGAELIGVRDQLRAIPNHGTGYGLLRYLCDDPSVRDAVAAIRPPDVGFNFWGDVSEYFTDQARPLIDHFGEHRSPNARRWRVIDVMGLALDGEIHMIWTYSKNLHRTETVERLAAQFVARVGDIVASRIGISA
ncbi:hypothetical protein JMUB6875_21160 [Nocardia sp. JMUB6875]|uniref:amino acid adenylation domain-containing protein n=1 Tax=Nocardia sp. JMUB6875 TaxID=3158170 RepID=UPI0032E58061